MSKNQKGLLKWKSFFSKKWFCLEMVWKVSKRENICDHNIFLLYFKLKGLDIISALNIIEKKNVSAR